jgi:hypothetical protein
MHVAWAANLIVAGVTIAMTFFFRARSLLPLAQVSVTGTRHVHPGFRASRSTPHPIAYD